MDRDKENKYRRTILDVFARGFVRRLIELKYIDEKDEAKVGDILFEALADMWPNVERWVKHDDRYKDNLEPYNNECPKCGLKLEGVVGYCCSDPRCPIGLGPTIC